MGQWAAVVLAKPAGRLEMLAKGALIQLAEPSGGGGGGGGGGQVDGTGCLDAAGQASWGSKLMQLHWSLQVATGWGGGGGGGKKKLKGQCAVTELAKAAGGQS